MLLPLYLDAVAATPPARSPLSPLLATNNIAACIGVLRKSQNNVKLDSWAIKSKDPFYSLERVF